MATFQLFFSVQGTTGSPTRPDPENRVGVIKTLESQVGHFLLGCKCPVSRGIVVQEQDPLGDLPAAGVFRSKCPAIAPPEMSNTRVDSLAIRKIINEEDAVLIPKNRGENFSSGFLHSDFLRGRGKPLCRHSIDCCFVSGS